MDKINNYLETIQEDKNLQEIDPIIGTTLIIGSAAVIKNFIVLMTTASAMRNQIKIDPQLSKEINDIMGSKNEWVVHVYHTREPNAFSLGFGRHIFITTALQKILNKDEVLGVLLHECWHSKSKHTYKNLAYKYPLFYLSSFVGVMFAVHVAPFGAIIAALMVNSVADILYNITFGRKHEYDSDSFAAKMGYGPQLISAFDKMQKWVNKHTQGQKCTGLCKVITSINRAIDEHPDDKKRVENILKKAEQAKLSMKKLSFKNIKDFVVKNWR
jgi:Zn-dependent protease with chaperone function